MYYKNDWDMTKKRLTAFWNGEIIDRCCVGVMVTDPSYVPDSVPQDPAAKEQYWVDPEQVIRRERRLMEHTYYGGDAFPCVWLNLGPSEHTAFFKGATPNFGDTTVWYSPAVSDPDELEYIGEKSYLYRKTIELAKALAEDSKGDYCVSMPDSSGNADVLANLMGSEEMLMAMLEEPEAVKRALSKIQVGYEQIISEVYGIVKDVNYGGSCVGWLNTWAPGLHFQTQCDLSVMISNSLFREFVLPELKTQCKFLEYPLYHFDGIEQARHLDDLLSIPELRIIQWTQVVGQPSCLEHMDTLKRIQDAGKSIFIVVEPNQIRPLMENLSSKGLYMTTKASSKEEADAILKEVAKLTHE